MDVRKRTRTRVETQRATRAGSPVVATQGQQLGERPVRSQATLEEADLLFPRERGAFITDEAFANGAFEYAQGVPGYRRMKGENRRALRCRREQPEEGFEDVPTANRRNGNEREHRFPPRE